MGFVQLPDHVMSLIQREVADGRAASEAAFLEAAVLRMVDDAEAWPIEAVDLQAVVAEGRADIAAGRFTTLSSPAEVDAFLEEIWQEVLADEHDHDPSASRPVVS